MPGEERERGLSVDIFQELHHVCMVVRDIGNAVRYYESLGIGPWHDYPPLDQFIVLDVPDRDAFMGLVFKWANIRNTQLQLCQPDPGDSPQRRFLDTRGEGVYHLGFSVPDCDAAEAAGVAARLSVSAKGRRQDASGFTYFRTPEAAVTLEVRASPKGV